MRTHKLISKFLSFVVGVTFLIPNSLPLYGYALSLDASESNSQIPFIPPSVGCVENAQEQVGNANRCVFLIRDAHAQAGIQTNIDLILKRLVETYPVGFVGVEGAQGYVDVSGYRDLPNKKARDQAALSLMKQARLTAPEYFAIHGNGQVPLFGVEDIALHRENIKRFQEALSSNADLMVLMNKVQAAFVQAKAQLFPPRLLELEDLISGFEAGRIDFSLFSKKIREIARRQEVSLAGTTNFNLLSQSLDLEKEVDFDALPKQTQDLVKDLANRLSPMEGRELVKQTLQHRVGRLGALQYYDLLLSLAGKVFQGKSLGRLSNLKRYQSFLVFTDQIKQEKVFEELRELQRCLKDRMITNAQWHALDRASERFDLLKNLLSLQLSAAQWDILQREGIETHVQALRVFFKESWDRILLSAEAAGAVKEIIQKDPGQWQAALDRAKSFYDLVSHRDNVLVANTLEEMDRQGTRYVVLVAGGFHTSGMKKLFQEKGVSCVVISPRTAGVEGPSRYQAIMMGWRHPLERILEMLWNGGLKGAPSRRLGAGQAYVPRKMGSLKAATIFTELETSKPEFYGLFRMFYTALQDGEMAVLETTDYKIIKKDDPADKDNRQFIYVDKAKGLSYLLGAVKVTRKEGEDVALDLESFQLDPAFKALGEDQRRAIVSKLGDIARMGVQGIKEKAPEGWKDSQDLLVSSIRTVAQAMDPNQRKMWVQRTVLSAAKALAPTETTPNLMEAVSIFHEQGNLERSHQATSEIFEGLIAQEYGDPFKKYRYINQDRDQTQREIVSQFIEGLKQKNERAEAISEKELAILYGFWNRYFNTDMAYQHIVAEDFNQVHAEWLMNDIAMNEKMPASIRAMAHNYYFLMTGDQPSIRWGMQPGDPAMPYAQMQRGVHNVLVRQDSVGFGFSEWMLGHRYAMNFLENDKNLDELEPEVKRILMKVRDTLRRSNAEEDRFGSFRLVTFRPDPGSAMEKQLLTETGGLIPLFLVFRTDEGRQVILQRNIRGFPKEQLAYLETLYSFTTANRTWDATYDRFYTETIRPGGDMSTWDSSTRLRAERLVRDAQKWAKAGRIVTAQRPKPCASCGICITECNELSAHILIDMATGKLQRGTVQSKEADCTNCELCTARCPFVTMAPKNEIPVAIEQERKWQASIYTSPHADYLSGHMAKDYVDTLEHQMGRAEAVGKRAEWRKGLLVKKVYEGPSIAMGGTDLKFILQKYQYPISSEEILQMAAGADPNQPLFDIVQYEIALNPEMEVLPYEKPMLVTVIRRHGETDPDKVLVIRRMKATAVQLVTSNEGKVELDMAAGAQLMGVRVLAIAHPELPVAKDNPALRRFSQLGMLEEQQTLQDMVDKQVVDLVLTRYKTEVPPEVSDALQHRAGDDTHVVAPMLPVMMTPSQDPLKKEFRDLMAEVWMKYPDLREGLYKLLRAWKEDMNRFSSHIHWQVRPTTMAPAGTACAGCPEFQIMAAGVYIATLQSLARGEVPDIVYTIETGCMSETNLKAEDASHGGGIAPRPPGGRTLFGAGFAFAEAVAQIKEMAIHYGFEKKGRKYVVSQGGDGGSYIGLPEWINALRSRAYQVTQEHKNVLHWIQITDTQGYSNTGGESSLSVPIGMAGKTTPFGALLYGMQHVQTNLINWAGEFPGILVGMGHSANELGVYEFYQKADRLGRSAMRWDWTPCEENMFLPNGADSNDWARIWAMAGLSPEVEFVGRFRKRVAPVNPHDLGKDPKTWRSRPEDMKELLYMMDSDPRFNSYMRRSARLVDVETRRQELAHFLKDGIEKEQNVDINKRQFEQFKAFLMEDGSLVADPEKRDKLATLLATKINLEKLKPGPKPWDRYKPYIHQEAWVVADPTAQAQLTQLVRYRDYMNWWIDAESAIAWRAEELADSFLKDMKAQYEKFKNTPERYKYSHMFDPETGEMKSEYGAELRQELIEMIIGGDFITEFQLMQKSLETQVKKPIEEFEATLDKQKRLLLARQELSDQLYVLLNEGERGEIDRILKITDDGKKMAEYRAYLKKLSSASDRMDVRTLIAHIFDNIKERDELLKVMDAQSEAAHKAMEGMLTEERKLREVLEKMRPFAKLEQAEEARGHATMEDARHSFLESTMDRLLADRANARLGAVAHWSKERMLKEAFAKKGGQINEKSYLQSSPAGAEFRAKLARLGGRLVHRVVSISGDRGITINRLLYNIGLQYGAWAEQMPLFKSSKRGEITTSGAVLSADKVEEKDWLKSLPSHIRSIPSYEGVKNVIDVFVEDQDPKGVLIINTGESPENVRNYLIGLFTEDKRAIVERVGKAAFDIANEHHQQILQRVSQKMFSKNYSGLSEEDLRMAMKIAEFEMYDQLVAQEMFQKDRENVTPEEMRQIRKLVAAAKVHIITVNFDALRDEVELGTGASNLIFMSQLYHALEYMGLPVDFQRDCGVQAGAGSGVKKSEQALLESDRFSEAMAGSRVGQIFKGIVKTPDRVRKYLTATRRAHAQTGKTAPPAGAYPFEKKYDPKDKEKFEKSPGGYVLVPTGGTASGWVISQMADEDQPVVYFGYPITPSGDVFASLAKLKAEGHPYIWAVDENVPMEKVNFEKLLGAAKMGYVLVTNATASQGYLHGSEVMGFAAGNRLPWIIVVCSRAESTSWLNIEGSQEDFMTFDKKGGIILMPKNVQEHVFALYLSRLFAPIVRLPVMVYLGGITDTHRQTIARIPTDKEVRAFFQRIFEKYDFLRQSLVNKQGETMFTGASAPAATYLESKAMLELAHNAAQDILPDLIAETEKLTGYSFDPAEVYPHYKSPRYWEKQDIKAGSGPPPSKARTAVVLMGTHVPTAEIVLDELAAEGFTDIAMVQPRFHNPTPDEEMAEAFTSLDAKTVLVMDMAGDPTRVSPTTQRVEGIHSRLMKGKPLQIKSFRFGEGGRDIPNAELRRHILDTHLLITEPAGEELEILKDLLPSDEELIGIQVLLEAEHKTADGEAMITRWLEEKAKADKDPYVSEMRKQIVSHLAERIAQKQRVYDWNLFAPETIRPHAKASREAERAKIRNKLVEMLLRKDYVNFLPFYGRVEFAELKEFHSISQINRETVQKIEILFAHLKLQALLAKPEQIFQDPAVTDNVVRQAIVLLEYSNNSENHKIAAQVLEKIIGGPDAAAAWKAYRIATGSKKYWKEAVAGLGHELDTPKAEMPQTEDFMGGVRAKPTREVHVEIPPPIQIQKSDAELKMLLEKIREIVNESREFPMNPVEIELEAMDRLSKVPESQLHGKKIYAQEDRRYREAYRQIYRKEVDIEVTRALFGRDIAPELKVMFEGEGGKAISRIIHGALMAHLLAGNVDLSQGVDEKQVQALVDPVDSHVLAYLKDVVYPELKSNPHIVPKDFTFYENYYNMVVKGEVAQEIKQAVGEALKEAHGFKTDTSRPPAVYDMSKRSEVQEFRRRLFAIVQRTGWQPNPATRDGYFDLNLTAALVKPQRKDFEGLFPALSQALAAGQTDAAAMQQTLSEWLGSEGVRQSVVEQAQRKRDAILADSRIKAERDSFHHLRTYYQLGDAQAEAAAQADPNFNPLAERIAKSLYEARNQYRAYRVLKQRLQAGEKINTQEELKLYLSGRLQEMRHGITRNNKILEDEILSGVKIFQTQPVDMQPWMRFFVDGADLVFANQSDAEKQATRFTEITQAMVNKGQRIDHPRDLQIFVRQSLLNNRGPREIVEQLEGRVANEVLGAMDLAQYVQLIMRQEEVGREFAWDEITGGYDEQGKPKKPMSEPLSLRLFVRRALLAGQTVDQIAQRLEGKVYGPLLQKGETKKSTKDVVEGLAKEEELTAYPVAAPAIYERLKATKEFKNFEDLIVWITERSKYKASSGAFPDADGLMKEAIAMGYNVGADKRGRLVPLKSLVVYNRSTPNARLVFDRVDTASVTGDIEKDLRSDETQMDAIVRTQLEQLGEEAALYFAKEGTTPQKGAGEQIVRYMVARAVASNREENLKKPGIADEIVKQVMVLGKKVPLLLTRRAGESRGYEEYGFFTEEDYRGFVEMEVGRYLDTVNRVLDRKQLSNLSDLKLFVRYLVFRDLRESPSAGAEEGGRYEFTAHDAPGGTFTDVAGRDVLDAQFIRDEIAKEKLDTRPVSHRARILEFGDYVKDNLDSESVAMEMGQHLGEGLSTDAAMDIWQEMLDTYVRTVYLRATAESGDIVQITTDMPKTVVDEEKLDQLVRNLQPDLGRMTRTANQAVADSMDRLFQGERIFSGPSVRMRVQSREDLRALVKFFVGQFMRGQSLEKITRTLTLAEVMTYVEEKLESFQLDPGLLWQQNLGQIILTTVIPTESRDVKELQAVADEILPVLAQQNCYLCGKPTCRSYSDALVRGYDPNANVCVPGGAETMEKVFAILKKHNLLSDKPAGHSPYALTKDEERRVAQYMLEADRVANLYVQEEVDKALTAVSDVADSNADRIAFDALQDAARQGGLTEVSDNGFERYVAFIKYHILAAPTPAEFGPILDELLSKEWTQTLSREEKKFLREHGEAHVEAAAQEAEDTYNWMRKMIVPHQAGEDLRRRGAEYKSIMAYQNANRLEDLSENDRHLVVARRLYKALDQAAMQHDNAFVLGQNPEATLQDKSDLLTVVEERFWEGLKIPTASQVYEALPEVDAAFQETMQDQMEKLRQERRRQTEATEEAHGPIRDINQLSLRIEENIDKSEAQQTKFHPDDYPWALSQEVQKGLQTQIDESFTAVWGQSDEVVQRHLSENLDIDQAELERFKNEPAGKAWSDFSKEFQKALLESIVTAQVEEFISERNKVFKLGGKLRSGRPVETVSDLKLLMKMAQRGVSVKALPLQIEDWTPKLLAGIGLAELSLDQMSRDYNISPEVRRAAVEEAIAQTVMSMVREELTQAREERNVLGSKVEEIIKKQGLLEIPSLSDLITEVVAQKSVDVEKVLPLERIGDLMAKLEAAWKVYHDLRTIRGTLKFVEGEREGTAAKITLTWARLPSAEQELIKRYLQGDPGTLLNWRNQKGPVQFAAAEIVNLVGFYVLTEGGADAKSIKEAILSRYNLTGMDDAVFTAFVDRQLKSKDQFANNKLGILVFKLAIDETDTDTTLKEAESGMKAGFAALEQDQTLMTRETHLSSAYQSVRQRLSEYYAEEIKKARRSTLLKRASEKIGQAIAWDRQRDAVDPIAVQVAIRRSNAKANEQDVMRFLTTLGRGVYETYHRGISRNAASLVRGVQGQLEAAILADQVSGVVAAPLAPVLSPFVEVRTEPGLAPEEVFACNITDFEIREDRITAGVTEDQFHRVHGLKAETIHFKDTTAGNAYLHMHMRLGLPQEQIKNLVHEMKILQRQAGILGVKSIVLHRNEPHAAHIDEDGTAHYALEAFLSYPISEDVVGDHVRTHALIPNEVEDTRIPQNMRVLAEEMAAIWHTLQRVKVKYSTKGVLHETFTKAFARGEGTLPGVDPEGKALALFEWYASREDHLDEDIFAKILEHIEASPKLYGKLLAEDVARLIKLKTEDRAQYEMVLQGMISKSLGNVGKLPKYKRLARQVKDKDIESLWKNLLNFVGKLGDENFDVNQLVDRSTNKPVDLAQKKPYEIWELIKGHWANFFDRELKYDIEPHHYYLYYQKTALHLCSEMPLDGVPHHRSFIRYLIENEGVYKKILRKQDRSSAEQIKEINEAIAIYNLIHKVDGQKVQYSPQQLELIRRAFFLRPEVVETVIQSEKRLAKYRSMPPAYANDAALNEVMRNVIDVFGWLPAEVIERISKGLDVPILPTRGRTASIHASILSYERFRLTKEPREVQVYICIGLPCALANQKERTGERFVEASRSAAMEAKFDFKTAACFGKCNLAPVIAVDRPGHPRVLLGNVNLDIIHAILKEVSGAPDLPNLVNFFGYWRIHLKLADETAFAEALLIANSQGLDADTMGRIKGYKLGIDYKGNMLVLGEMGTGEPLGTFVNRSVSFEYTDTDGQNKIGTLILDQADRVKAKIQYQADQAFEKEVGTAAAQRVSTKDGQVFLEGRTGPIGRIQSNTVALVLFDGSYASITLSGENQAAPLQTSILDRPKEVTAEDLAFLEHQDRVLLNPELRVEHPWDIEEYLRAGGYATVKDFLDPERTAKAYLEKLHALAGEAGKPIELFQKQIAIIQGVRAWKMRQKKIEDSLRSLRADQLSAILAGDSQALKAVDKPVKEMAITQQELQRAVQQVLGTTAPALAPEYFPEDFKYGNVQTEAERDFFKALAGLNEEELKTLADIHPSQKIINEVRDANLLGRGGAGFPAAMKMQVTKDAEIIRVQRGMNEPVQTKYWVVNLDEGDPGAFIDRSIAEERSHQLIEGAILGSLAIGARDINIYIRSEYDDAVRVLERAIGEARRKGLLGKNIFGIPGLDLDVHITHGAGSFLAGEKRAILLSTMGGPAEPDLAVDRADPRESLLKGLWDQPQDTQNAKSTAFLPMIMKIGGKAFSAMGYYVIELPRFGTVKTLADAAEEKVFLEQVNTAKIVLREGGSFLLEFKDRGDKERFLDAYAEAEIAGPNTYKLSAKAFRIMPFESKEQEEAFLRDGRGLKILLREGGTFAYSVSGAVRKTGRVEIRVGRTIRDIERIAGGPQPGKVIRGVQFGGPSGAFLNRNMNPDIWDAPLAFGTFKELAMIHGSGGAVFLDESADILPVVRDWTHWLQREACGQCGCEKGSKSIADWIDVILQGNGDSGTIAILKEQGSIETVSSKCGLGLTAANPALTTLRNFPVDYLHALLANGKIDKDELFRILQMLGLATSSLQEDGRNKYILGGSSLKFILSEFDIIDKYRTADKKRKGRFLSLLGLTPAQAAQPRGDTVHVAATRQYDLSKVSRQDGAIQVSFFRRPPEQPLLVSRAARRKANLSKALYKFTAGPEKGMKGIAYDSSAVHELAHKQNLYPREIIALGILHEARHAAIAQIKENVPDLLTQLKLRLEKKMTPQGLRAFLKAFLLTFPEPDLYDEIVQQGIDEDMLHAITKQYLTGQPVQGGLLGALDTMLDGWLDKQGLEWAIEEVLVRSVEAQNAVLRSHPLIASDFLDQESFKVVTEEIGGFFQDPGISAIVIRAGPFKDKPVSLSLLQFSNGQNFTEISLRDQLINAHRQGFDLHGIDMAKVKTAKYRGNPLATLRDGRLEVNPNSEDYRYATSTSLLSQFISDAIKALMSAAKQESPSQKGIVMADPNRSDWLDRILLYSGLKNLPVVRDRNVRQDQALATVNWLVLVATMAERDPFLINDSIVIGWREFLKTKFAGRQAEPGKKINVKALTLKQIEQDFLDVGTRAMIQEDIEAGIQYVVLIDKYMPEQEVYARLGKSNFNPEWIKQGKVLLVEAVENNTLNVDDAVAAIQDAIKKARKLETLPEDMFKAFVQDPENPTEDSNFTVAFHEGLKLAGRHTHVRHINVREGVRLSETLTFLHGLFNAPLKVVIEEMRSYLLDQGFTAEEIDELVAFEGDVLVPPPALADIVNQMQHDRTSAVLINWAA